VSSVRRRRNLITDYVNLERNASLETLGWANLVLLMSVHLLVPILRIVISLSTEKTVNQDTAT
jgi:hypothetical protein